MKTPIVTLTTDWGNQGFFAGMVKGMLYNLAEGIQVVDIAHHLTPFHVIAATFVVKHSCMGFPPGTIHLIDVSSNPTPDHPFIVARARGQYFICCDNGVPAMALGDELEEAVSLPLKEGVVYNFAAYSLFPRVVRDLLNGVPLNDLGPRHNQLLQRNLVGWVPQGENDYRVYIHYVDNYGNAYLGMTFREMEELRRGRSFRMQVREQIISEVSSSYYQVSVADRQQPLSPQEEQRRKLRLTVSATGVLELALREGSLSQLFGLGLDDMVLLTFY